jgi:hypothetical protein
MTIQTSIPPHHILNLHELSLNTMNAPVYNESYMYMNHNPANGSPSNETSDEGSEKVIARIVHLSLFSKKKDIQKNVITTYFDANAGML